MPVRVTRFDVLWYGTFPHVQLLDKFVYVKEFDMELFVSLHHHNKSKIRIDELMN